MSRTLKALPTMLRVGFAETVAYRAEFLVWVLAYTMPLIMLALWTAVAREAPVGRFGEKEFQAYFLLTLVVRLATGSWVVWEMNLEIRQGTLQKRLLRPVHPLLAYACENVAAMPLRILVSLPILGATLVWLGPSILADDPLQLVLAPVAVAGAWVITFLVMAMIGTLGLWWESSLSLFDLWLGFYIVLSGYVMPLELFPPWLREASRWLPFRYMLAFPVENALGLLDRGAALEALAIQWAWAFALLAAALLLWRRGVRRFAAFGG